MLESPRLYFYPFTPETLKIYLVGLNRGILISNELLDFSDIIHARRDVIVIRGWGENSLAWLKNMRSKGMSEEEIINEFINIEIDTWRIIEEKT
jgi:hypothetical protein